MPDIGAGFAATPTTNHTPVTAAPRRELAGTPVRSVPPAASRVRRRLPYPASIPRPVPSWQFQPLSIPASDLLKRQPCTSEDTPNSVRQAGGQAVAPARPGSPRAAPQADAPSKTAAFTPRRDSSPRNGTGSTRAARPWAPAAVSGAGPSPASHSAVTLRTAPAAKAMRSTAP